MFLEKAFEFSESIRYGDEPMKRVKQAIERETTQVRRVICLLRALVLMVTTK